MNYTNEIKARLRRDGNGRIFIRAPFRRYLAEGGVRGTSKVKATVLMSGPSR
ncbi:hypothetical protein IF2G_06466 [Cordyceps javanica]|nr:hypothetical protein IF2G_06466 [Cordyceps javanica]